MILTEKEALRKYCPHGMNAGLIGCLASECMAWRSAFDADGHHLMKQVAPPSECPDCKGTGAIRNDTDTDDASCASCDGDGKIGHYERAGFCGLAGKPGVAG